MMKDLVNFRRLFGQSAKCGIDLGIDLLAEQGEDHMPKLVSGHRRVCVGMIRTKSLVLFMQKSFDLCPIDGEHRTDQTAT